MEEAIQQYERVCKGQEQLWMFSTKITAKEAAVIRTKENIPLKNCFYFLFLFFNLNFYYYYMFEYIVSTFIMGSCYMYIKYLNVFYPLKILHWRESNVTCNFIERKDA